MRVKGTYYDQQFTGTVRQKEPNWIDNGKGRGVHLHVDLDSEIKFNGLTRDSLFLSGWIDGKQYHWGSATSI